MKNSIKKLLGNIINEMPLFVRYMKVIDISVQKSEIKTIIAHEFNTKKYEPAPFYKAIHPVNSKKIDERF